MFLNSSTLASLRYFIAAARVSSFKRAAVDLHVTQGAVSQQIKHLEQALGVKLFYRLVRQIELTEEGRRFAVVVEQALNDIERSAQAITAVQGSIDIRLRAGPSLSLRWLVPRLGDFYARHTGIRLFLNAAYGAFDPDRREFDLAIELTKGQLAGMHSEVLMDEYLVPVCGPEYLKSHLFLRKPKDLAGCTLLHDAHPWSGAPEDAEWRHWLNEVGAVSVNSNQGQFFSLANMAIEAALRQQGVAMARALLIEDLVESGQLVMPFRQRVKCPTRYCLVYHKELAARPSMRAVIQWLHEMAAAPQDSSK
jgi:LysR family transcriptional regulator, glycine cleavage system transcriptional activator